MILQVDNFLYRGPRPNSYQELKDAGIKVVINLQSGVYEALNDDNLENENPADFGIVDHYIPCNDITPPTITQVRLFLKIHLDATGPVYVHCRHGKDRTGYMCAAYRIIHGWSYKDAIKEMFDLGFHKWPYIWWSPFLKYFEKNRAW